jgi:signal transduction histidine kinase
MSMRGRPTLFGRPDGRQDILIRLAQHRVLGDAPAAEHEWLVDHGKTEHYPAGHVVTKKGEQTYHMIILLDGHVVIRSDRGAGAHKIFEWRSGDVGGRMPYSRGASPPMDAVAEKDTDVLAIESDCFPDMIRDCPVVTAKLVHVMLDRARTFTSADLRDEKLISLGKLAAGLAHELNNPASAVVRSSKTLMESLSAAEDAARILVGAKLTEAQFAAIEKAREICESSIAAAPRTPLERADREDALLDWLTDHRATEEYAVPLADTGVTPSALDLLAESVQGQELEAALGWITASCTVRTLASEIEKAAVRIHDLVSAVKGFSYMDHAPTPEPVDIRQGINDTLKMLASKTRAKGVTVTVDFPDTLPRAYVVGVELNQVWMNLIDNALDAAPAGGNVEVNASVDRDRILVRIIDDGAGVPKEIQARIFEPFFTTKGVGKGTGLGLDVVRRLVQRQEGSVDLESVPGRTEFQVRLPMA